VQVIDVVVTKDVPNKLKHQPEGAVGGCQITSWSRNCRGLNKCLYLPGAAGEHGRRVARLWQEDTATNSGRGGRALEISRNGEQLAVSPARRGTRQSSRRDGEKRTVVGWSGG
jgi:hypothetical protein